jgi:hypothetical protein
MPYTLIISLNISGGAVQKKLFKGDMYGTGSRRLKNIESRSVLSGFFS